MRNPFKRREKALTGDAGVISALSEGFAPFQLLGSGSRDRITAIYNSAQSANYSWLYIKSPAVRTVIDCIVRNVGELDLCLYEIVDEKERKPLDDHPAARSMKYPGNSPSDSLIRELFKDYLIHDNAYAILVPGVNDQMSIARIPAYMVEVQGSSMWQVDRYRVWPQGAFNSNGSFSGGSGTWTDLTPDEVFHWHGENPLDPRIGVSHLDTLRGVIAEDAALQQANVELAKSGLQSPVWVFRPLDAPQWSNEARDGFEQDLRNRLVRARDGTPPVMEEGMEVRDFGVSPHDAEMMAARQWMISQVASEFGMPLGKVGLREATTEDEESLITDVLTPYCSNFTKMLDWRLLQEIYDLPNACFEFNLDERMMGNARLTALTSAAGVPPLLRNEARAKLGLPPVQGGDEPATPANVTLGEDPNQVIMDRQEAAAPKPGSQVMPIQDPNKPPQDGSYRQEDGPTPTPSTNGGKALTTDDSGSQTPSKTVPQSVPQFLPARSADIERQRRNVDALQAVMQRYYNRFGRSARKKAVEQIDWERWDRELTDDLILAFKTVVQHEGDIYALKFMGSNFDMGHVQNYLQAMAEGAAGAINDTIRGEINDLGVDGALARAPQHVQSAGTGLGAKSTIWAREEAARQSGTFPDADQDMGRE